MARKPRKSKSPITRELVRRAQAGDRAAFDCLRDQLHTRLHSLVSRKVAEMPYVEAEDVLQETWTRTLESIQRFEWRGRESFFRWLAGISQNVIKKQAEERRRPNAPRSHNFAADDIGCADDRRVKREQTTGSQMVRREERYQRFAAAFDGLSSDHRQVVFLARLRGLTMNEVAQRMGRSREAASMLLLRALQKIRRGLGSTGSLSLPKRPLDLGETGPGSPEAPPRQDGSGEDRDDGP